MLRAASGNQDQHVTRNIIHSNAPTSYTYERHFLLCMTDLSLQPTFYVGHIPVYGDAILSPMAGFSDVPYRAICRAYGSAMHYTEFVPVEALQGKRNRFWDRLDYQLGEHPMVFQIFGNDAQMILNAALRIEELGPDIIDINMGCSTRRVSGRGAGVGMMREPELVAETFALLSKHLQVPVTGKIRIGWDDQKNFLEIGRIMEDNGAQLVAIHGRTKEQKYRGQANWDAIAELKQAVNIPVIGNGDITEPADIERMKTYTGCDAVMIGRGAIGNPWIFARKRRQDLTFSELAEGIRIHVHEMVNYYGNPYGLVLFRKHFQRYVQGVVGVEEQLQAMITTKSLSEFLALLDEAEARLSDDYTLPAKELQLETVSCETAS